MSGLRALAAGLVLALGLLAGGAHAQSDSDAPAQGAATGGALSAMTVVGQAVNHYILPGYERVATEAGLMDIVMGDLCSSRDEPRLEVARRQFRALVLAWARVDFVRFGPVTQNNRLERILFWPDRKGTGLKQVQALLASKDESAANFITLRDKSVALQGLGALEFVLYGTGADTLLTDEGAFRCRYGVAIAAGLGQTVQEIIHAWEDPADMVAGLQHPAADHPLYRNETEALEAVIGVFPHGIELLRDTRLVPFMGTDADHAAPKAALFWRSGLSIPMLAAGFQGMADFFEIAQFGQLLSKDNRWLAGSIQFEFANLARTFAAVDQPVDVAVTDPAFRGRLTYALVVARSLHKLIGEEMTGALGLSVGFSALDGD